MTPLRRAGATGLAILTLAAAGAGLSVRGTALEQRDVEVARRGTLIVSITESGTLRADASATFRSPIEGREVEITWLAPEGSYVRAGDPVARLDTAALRTDLERALQAVRQIEMDIDAARLEREEAVIAVRAVTDGAGRLAVEEGRTELLLLQGRAQRLREEQERLQPLLIKGYITREEFDRAGLDADEAEARAALGERAFRILSERTHPASEKTALLQLARREARLAHLAPTLEAARTHARSLITAIERCSINASHPGLVMYEENLSVLPRRKIRTGDRVTPSQGLITLPDLRTLTIAASVREADVRLVAPGQRARVMLDAFPGRIIEGSVARIGAVARADGESSDGARFDLVVALTPSPDLRPAMNARVDVIVAEAKDVILVPSSAVFERDGAIFCHVVRGASIERRPVRTGRSNGLHTEIIAGLDPGEPVSLIDLDAPAHDSRR